MWRIGRRTTTTTLPSYGRRFHHADERGSIVALTDDTGSAVVLNSYDDWGIPGDANGGRFQYTGQIQSPYTRLYYYKARWYSPTLGRFMQTDPIGYEDGMNMYAYVGNDPVNLSDPTGLATEDEIRDAENRIAKYRRQIQRERRSLRAPGSRIMGSNQRARAARLGQIDQQLSELDPAQVADMRVGAPSSQAAANISSALDNSPSEQIVVSTPNGGRPALNSQRSADSGSGYYDGPMDAMGHPHPSVPGNEYPGIGDPANVWTRGVPMIYRYEGVDVAIGFNGQRFTLHPLESNSLPAWSDAPRWMEELFEPW